MASILNNEAMRTFIDKYRRLPQLWKVKSDLYRNKNLRDKGWEELLIYFKEVERDATLGTMKRRILTMRECYRRELNKKIKSEKYGTGDDVYVPSLWYFYELDFLREQETQFLEITSRHEGESDDDPEEFTDSTKRKRSGQNENYPKSGVERLEDLKGNRKDEAAIYAEGWAVSYRKLKEKQQLYAKKAIEEIFILGQINELNIRTVATTHANSPSFTFNESPSGSVTYIPSTSFFD